MRAALLLLAVCGCSAASVPRAEPPPIAKPVPSAEPRRPEARSEAWSRSLDHDTALALLERTTSLHCTFPEWTGYAFDTHTRTETKDVTTIVFDAIDLRARTARTIAQSASANAAVMSNDAGLHLVEEAAVGNMFFTSVFADGERRSDVEIRFSAARSSHLLIPRGYTIGERRVARTGPAVSTIVGWCRPTGFSE